VTKLAARIALAAAIATASGCGREIVLGDSDSAVCLGLGCGGVGQAGNPGLAGTFAGSLAQAGTGSPAAAGSVGSTGGGGGDSGGSGGSGTGGGSQCTPSATDESCDGLDEKCEPIPDDDAGCPGTCEGSFVDGTSYMSCLAARDFDAAEAACQANGMHLVKIDSAQENATVLSLALDDYVWIGGSNRDDASVYTWLDGTTFYESDAPVAGVYQNFNTSEPSSDAELRCLQLREQGDGVWSMWRCSGMQSFVCERYAF
jgi:hypothetical protein